MNIDRKQFIEGMAAAVAAGAVVPSVATSATLPGRRVLRGRVTGGGTGLPGVTVSDGLKCVKTDKSGYFALPRRDGARFITVCPNCGWKMKGWYREIGTMDTGYDFALEKASAGAPKCGCRFVHITDTEIDGVSAENKKWIEEVRRIAAAENCAFVVHTGDICYLAGLQAHAEMMTTETMGLPMLYCIGNHDLVAGEYGEKAYEDLLGPCRYSFNAGGIHFLVVPMIEGWDFTPKYAEDEIAEWIRNDLALVKPNQPVMVFSHMIFHAKNESEAGLVIGKTNPLNLKEACNFKGFFYGHVHNTYTSTNGGVPLVTTSNPNKGGIDHSPEIVRVVDVKADGSFTMENHYGRHLQYAWPTVRAGAAWERRLPAPVLFCTPLVRNGMVFVGTTDDENRKTGAVIAFDAATGAAKWRRKVANSIKNRFVAAGGNIVVQDAGGHVYAFAEGTGNLAWEAQLPYDCQVLESAPAVSEDGATVFVGMGARLTALDAATGTVKWRNTAWNCEPVACAPGVGGGKVVCSANWEGLECNDAATGERLWRLDGKPWTFPGSDPLVEDGKVVVASYWQLCEVDLATGTVLRKKDLDEVSGMPTGPILAAGGKYLFGTRHGGLFAVDKETFETAWQGAADMSLLGVGAYRVAGRMVNTSPVLADSSTVCAACADGIIHFWNFATGEETRRIATGAPYLAGAAVADGRLYAADMAGILRMWQLKG